MEPMGMILYSFIFLFGLVIGSFLNVCIYRIPEKQSIVWERSHCMNCGSTLKWYELVPVASWVILGGRCRKCRASISKQYPLVELGNGLLYLMIFLVQGWEVESIFYCLLASALLVLSVIDWRTYEIPFGINCFIGLLGILHVAFDYENWMDYVLGFFVVSAVLEILLLASRGRAIGGGDVKLMAAAGLLLGWKKIILAFLLGCVLGSVIHLIRMKVSKAEHVLAMGPYLSAGILIAALWGDAFLQWYLGSLGL